jgi:hypothetical protein
MRFNSLFLATAALALTSSLASAQEAKMFTGTVTDAMCGKKHMMAGKSAAECTRACVKEGSDYALVAGGKVYTLKGDNAAIDKFAGANVVVKGTLSGSTLKMESIKAAK